MLDLVLYPLLAGLCIAAIAGPLGCFVVWNKMAYFGDTLAHSALLGVALAFMLQLNVNISILVVCMVIALLLLLVNEKSRIANDTMLGIFAHGSLALGLVLSSRLDNIQFDLMAYLFGDLLTVNLDDVLAVALISFVVICLLSMFWRQLLSVTVNEELAKVEGINVFAIRFLLMALFACVVAFAIKVVGVLLITALLIIPAASARISARSPEAMAFYAAFIGAIAVILGLGLSFYQDTPAGPSIVLVSFILFILSSLLSRTLLRNNA